MRGDGWKKDGGRVEGDGGWSLEWKLVFDLVYL
jgi:hypothetical protein